MPSFMGASTSLLLLLVSLLAARGISTHVQDASAKKGATRKQDESSLEDKALTVTLQQLRAELSGGNEADDVENEAQPRPVSEQLSDSNARVLESSHEQLGESNDQEMHNLQVQIGEGLEREQKLTEELRASEASSAWLAGELHSAAKEVEVTKRRDNEDRVAALNLEGKLKRVVSEKADVEVQAAKLKRREKWLAGVVRKMLLADGELQRRTEKLRGEYKSMQQENAEMAETNAALSRSIQEKDEKFAKDKTEADAALKETEEEKEIEKRSLSSKEADLTSARKRVSELEEASARLRAEIEKYKNLTESGHKLIQELESKVTTVSSARDEAAREYKTLKKGMCLSVQKKLAKESNEKVGLKKAFDAAKKQNEQIREQNAAYRAAIGKTRKQLSSMMKRSGEMGQRMNNEIAKLHRQLQERENFEAMRNQQLAQREAEAVQRRVSDIANSEEREGEDAADADDAHDSDGDNNAPASPDQLQDDSSLSERLSRSSQDALNEALQSAEGNEQDEEEGVRGFLPRRHRSVEDQDSDE